MSIQNLKDQARTTARAAPELSILSAENRNLLLLEIRDQLLTHIDEVCVANSRDLEAARQNGTGPALLDRLRLDEERIRAIASSIDTLIGLPDPIGELLESISRPNGILIEKRRVAIGTLGIIYEARPNVTVDSATMCLKTGNAVLLRGSSSAIHSNRSLVQLIQAGLRKTGVNADCVQLVEELGRESVKDFIQLTGLIDAVVPRGGADLINFVVQNATVPVLETGAGNCHAYIDETAQTEMAIQICLNAKAQRPSVCNAVETILVHSNWAVKHLVELVERLKVHHVTCRGCQKTRSIVNNVTEATEEDWRTEFLDYIVAIKVVDSLDEAISHISRYGTKHSEVIITEDIENARQFMQKIDAAVVYHNASTRFTDGGEFGFGAEIGISTQKLHARGPMGLRELTSYKYFVYGQGQIRT